MKVSIQIEAEGKDISRLSEIFAGLGRFDEEGRHPPEKVEQPVVEVPKELPSPVLTAADPAELEKKAEKLYAESNKQAGSHKLDRNKLVRLKWEVIDTLWDVICTPAVLNILGSWNRRALLKVAYHKMSATSLWQSLHIRRPRLDLVMNPRTLRVFEGSLGSLNRQYKNTAEELTDGRTVQ